MTLELTSIYIPQLSSTWQQYPITSLGATGRILSRLMFAAMNRRFLLKRATYMHKVSIPQTRKQDSCRHYSFPTRYASIKNAFYATKPPTNATTAAANKANEAVDDVGVIAGAALVIDVVA